MRRLRRIALIFLWTALITPIAFTQPRPRVRKHVTGEPIVLSKWIRHVGLHYLELIDNSTSTHNPDEFALNSRFLDDEEHGLNIDADGADRVFVEEVLKSLRILSAANYFDEGGHCSIGRIECAGIAVEAPYYRKCRLLTEEMIEKGELKPFGECSFERLNPIAEAAQRSEEEEVKQVNQRWAKEKAATEAAEKKW